MVSLRRTVTPVISRRVNVIGHLLGPNANFLRDHDALTPILPRALPNPVLVVLWQDLLVACPRRSLRDGERVRVGPLVLPGSHAKAASVGLVAPELVALAARGLAAAEEGAQADLAGAFAEEGLDDWEVGDDDGDEGLAACPLTSRHGTFRAGLLESRC